MSASEKLPPHDQFHLLRGRVRIRQGQEGLRAGTDAVLLGAFPLAKKRVLELGCGVGQALLCYAQRNPMAKNYIGVERLPDQASLAKANAHDNGVAEKTQIIAGDFTNKAAMAAAGLASNSVDLVLCNPPYFVMDSHTMPKDTARQASHIEDTPLSDWVAHGLRYCQQFGWFCMIHRPERLGEIFASLLGKAGNIHILPIASRADQSAKRVLVFAQKSRHGGTQILPPLVMHEAEAYSPQAKRILEDAMGLDVALDGS